jgi:hypothetical protein
VFDMDVPKHATGTAYDGNTLANYNSQMHQTKGPHPNEMSKFQLDFTKDAVVTMWYKPTKDSTPCDV